MKKRSAPIDDSGRCGTLITRILTPYAQTLEAQGAETLCVHWLHADGPEAVELDMVRVRHAQGVHINQQAMGQAVAGLTSDLMRQWPQRPAWKRPAAEWSALVWDIKAGAARLTSYRDDKPKTLITRRRILNAESVQAALSRRPDIRELLPIALQRLQQIGVRMTSATFEGVPGDADPGLLKLASYGGSKQDRLDATTNPIGTSGLATFDVMRHTLLALAKTGPADEMTGCTEVDADTLLRWNWTAQARTPLHPKYKTEAAVVRAKQVRSSRTQLAYASAVLPVQGILFDDVVSAKGGIA